MRLPDVADLLVVGGLAALSFGLAQISIPLAWIVAGALMMGLGLAVAWQKGRSKGG